MTSNAENPEVYGYDIKILRQLIASKSETDLSTIAQRLHPQYFEEYFTKLKAKTILVENRYIDRDYLEDFSAYYVRCFASYKRFCTRLHFFSCKFTEDEINGFLQNPENATISLEALNENYLGFIVVKPLPKTVVGRTCLKTYPGENQRHFPVIREYFTHPFGMRLKVKSLAFQEQDQITAACATSALWSAFHGTGKHFQHTLPSPIEITRLATQDNLFSTRVLPNEGLGSLHMARAIKSIGLEPYYVKPPDLGFLKEIVYAYLRGGIPAILGVQLWDCSNQTCQFIDRHAVAVSGYRLANAAPSSSAFATRASKITKIYVHDDQVGPFARMEFDGRITSLQGNASTVPKAETLSTSFASGRSKVGSTRAFPEVLIVPLYHKIRIPYATVRRIVRWLNRIIKWTEIPLQINEWDIYLTTINELKAELSSARNNSMPGKYRAKLLCESLPRFLWRACAHQDEKRLFDLLFDATDIAQGSIFVRAIEWDENAARSLRKISAIDGLEQSDSTETQVGRKIISWFREQESREVP